MEKKSCSCFLTGFCPYEEFEVTSFTERCPLPHINSEKDEYNQQVEISGIDREALEQYQIILSEIDQKLILNKETLITKEISEKYRNALIKCEQLIDLNKLEMEDYNKVHTLLQIHGELIEDVIKDDSMLPFSVCENCSAFIEGDKCTHKFCEKYRTLREIVHKLDRKIKNSNMKAF